MSPGDFFDRSLQLGKVAFVYVPVMRSDGETFSLNQGARHAGEFFMKLFLRCIQCWQKLCRFLPPQAARSGNIKSVAAGVNDPIYGDPLANVFEFPATEDCDRHFRRECAQDCPSGIHKHRLLRLTNNRGKRAVVVEKNRKAAVARASDFFNVLKCGRKHV